MATTEHILRLQAVLDSRQVQQELQRLRQMQQQIQTAGGTGGAGGAGAGAMQNQRNLNNVVQLGTEMRKLTAEIWRLDSSILKLNAQMTRVNSYNASQQAGRGGRGPQSPAVAPGGALGRSMQQMFSGATDKAFYEAITQHGKALPAESFESIMRGKLPSDTFYAARMQRFRDIIGPTTSYNEYLKTVNSKEFQGLVDSSKGTLDQQLQKRLMRGIVGQFAGSVLSQAVDPMRELGWNTAATVTSATSQAAQYGSMGFMVGGPGGAIAGAIGGAVIGALEELNVQSEKLAKSFQDLYNKQQDYKQTIKSFVKETGFEDWKDSLEGLSKEAAKSTYEEKKTALKGAKAERTAFAASVTGEQMAAIQRYLDKMNEAGDDMDERNKIERQYTEEIRKLANKCKTLNKNVDDAQRAFDAIEKEQKSRDQKAKEEQQKAKQKAEKEKQFQRAWNQDEWTRNFTRFQRTAGLDVVEQGLEANRKLRQKAIEEKDLDKFQLYSGRLTAYENMQQRIKDYQESSQLNLSRMDESYENSRILERYGIGGGRGLREAMMGYARQAASERERYEQLTKEGKLFEAEKARESWQYAAGERNTLADQLLQVLGNRTADLTNVTSLASMGFGMGEVNDNYDRQMKVWEDQRDLQRDIKNILSEKTFKATYGE